MWRQQVAYFPEGRTEESGVFVGGLQKNVIHRVAEPPPDLDEFEADIMASDAAHGDPGPVHCGGAAPRTGTR
jgi:hypothetical protein